MYLLLLLPVYRICLPLPPPPFSTHLHVWSLYGFSTVRTSQVFLLYFLVQLYSLFGPLIFVIGCSLVYLLLHHSLQSEVPGQPLMTAPNVCPTSQVLKELGELESSTHSWNLLGHEPWLPCSVMTMLLPCKKVTLPPKVSTHCTTFPRNIAFL